MRAEFHNEDCVIGMQEHVETESIDLLIADPPFAIDGSNLESMYNRKSENVLQGYQEVHPDDYFNFTRQWIAQAERVLRPGGSMYIVSGYSNLNDILTVLDFYDDSLEEINHIIWKFNFGVYTKKKFVSSHYHILFYQKTGAERTFNMECRYGKDEVDENGGKLNYQDREDVWIINKEYSRDKIKNSNKLPTALVKKMIQYSSNKGDIILDPFLGNGTTAQVASPLQRHVIGFEINEEPFKHLYKKDLDNTMKIE